MAEPAPPPQEHHLLRDADDQDRWAWRARIRRNPLALFWYRIGVGVLGGLLMLAAALTGWLPGPGGIPLFMLGLVVWASEFEWAHSVLTWFSHQFERVAALPVRTRRALVTGCVVAALGTWYGLAAWHGLPGWLPTPVAGVLDSLPLVER